MDCSNDRIIALVDFLKEQASYCIRFINLNVSPSSHEYETFIKLPDFPNIETLQLTWSTDSAYLLAWSLHSPLLLIVDYRRRKWAMKSLNNNILAACWITSEIPGCNVICLIDNHCNFSLLCQSCAQGPFILAYSVANLDCQQVSSSSFHICSSEDNLVVVVAEQMNTFKIYPIQINSLSCQTNLLSIKTIEYSGSIICNGISLKSGGEALSVLVQDRDKSIVSISVHLLRESSIDRRTLYSNIKADYAHGSDVFYIENGLLNLVESGTVSVAEKTFFRGRYKSTHDKPNFSYHPKSNIMILLNEGNIIEHHFPLESSKTSNIFTLEGIVDRWLLARLKTSLAESNLDSLNSFILSLLKVAPITVKKSHLAGILFQFSSLSAENNLTSQVLYVYHRVCFLWEAVISCSTDFPSLLSQLDDTSNNNIPLISPEYVHFLEIIIMEVFKLLDFVMFNRKADLLKQHLLPIDLIYSRVNSACLLLKIYMDSLGKQMKKYEADPELVNLNLHFQQLHQRISPSITTFWLEDLRKILNNSLNEPKSSIESLFGNNAPFVDWVLPVHEPNLCSQCTSPLYKELLLDQSAFWRFFWEYTCSCGNIKS